MADSEFRIESDSPAAGELLFWSIAGHEALARPAAYELAVLSPSASIAARDILGRAFDVVIVFHDADGGRHERHCQGHAVRLTRLAQVGRFHEYRIALRSWFGLLAHRTNSRILQDKPVLDVLDAVFEDSPIQRFKKVRADDVLGVHKPRRYCVQHQESDYAFLSRLLEDEGIYYWFDAHDAPGTMHLADASDVAHPRLPAEGTLRYVPVGASEARYNEITRWASARRFDTGLHAARDSDFKAIRKRLATDKDVQSDHELADFEAFEYPGGYFSGEDADTTAQRRGEEIGARRERHWALTGWPDVAVGRSFRFEGDPDGERDGDYLIAACTFAAAHTGYESEGIGDTPRRIADALRAVLADDAVNAETRDVFDELMAGTPELREGSGGGSAFLLTLLPAAQPFRPPRLTPRARMPGPQTAIVVGAAGKEHDVDAFGRVKVHFHWDRYDASDERSTCWLRVSQPWAGKGWGGYFAPRIGQEVVVEFLNGDPDRPIVTGRVYNDDQPIPYKSATHSGFKTHSTPGGSPKNFNELRFEDRKNGEQVFLHAERRMDVRVKRNKYETVQGTSQTHVGGAHALTTGANLELSVGADWFARIEGKIELSTGGNLTLGVRGDSVQHARGTFEVNARSITLEAQTAVVLKVGSSFIEVAPGGVTIVGPMVRINSGGAAAPSGPADVDDPLQAATADNGEPGYLDRLPRGGGGGGRYHRHSDGYHARPVVRQNDGSFTYGGSGIRVSGSPEYVDKTLQTLASLDGTPTGHTLIDNLQSNGHTAHIEQNDAAAAAGGGGLTTTRTANGFPAGTAVNMGPPTGTQTSDGSGSDSTVNWTPGTNAQNNDAAGNAHTQPDEALLGHELIHADHNGRGQNLAANPDPADATGNQEESRTIGIHDHANEPVSENNILRDLGEDWRRADHDSTATAVPP